MHVFAKERDSAHPIDPDRFTKAFDDGPVVRRKTHKVFVVFLEVLD